MHFSKRMWLLLALLALLPVMAFIQYRWIGQVSEAAQQRAKARLENSVEQLITEFDAEITRAHMTFWQMSTENASPSARFAQRYQEWNRLAPYPQLIREVYLIETADDSFQLSHIDTSGQILRLADWPADLAEARSRLEQLNVPGPPGFRRTATLDDLSVNGNPAFLTPMREARPAAEPFRRRPPRNETEPRFRGPSGRDERWRPPSRMVGWAVVALNADYIKREFLPDLTKRLFTQSGESDYELLVVKAGEPEQIVFQSDPAPTRGLFTSPDATASLFAFRTDCFLAPMSAPGGPGPRPFSPGGFSLGSANEILSRKPFPCGKAAMALAKADGKWKLLVKHRAGSLDTAFATFRLRTMAISFGVLLVLALGITMLTVSTERARVLAKLQMEFAMGISHELRTPLTVIRVAADNLANGMMVNAQHAQKYGRLIGDEARRLTDMVEQILTFARTQSPRGGSDLSPVAPEHIVRRALAVCGPALREAGMEIERFVDPGLPLVSVDENLIVDCLQNLLNNAVKYASSGGWVRVRAEAVSHRDGPRLLIAVEDRGPGISPDELPHIFDPFYRGEAVRNSQIPGVGLGLSLVKRIIEAHHGTIEVKSSESGGAAFILYLPAQPAAVAAEAEMKEVAS